MRGLFFFIYIIKCNDNSFYTGITNDIDRRMEEHISGINPDCYTYPRRPLTLEHIEQFYDFATAERREKQIKGWSRRKKEALIKGELQKLVEYSKNNQAHDPRQGKIAPA